MELVISAVLFVIGLTILIKGSDFFISGAAFMAKHFGVSELIIGLTLVSMGTSLPELGASVYASATGSGGVAVGNVVGSNIANIALVLGACLILGPIAVKKKMLRRDGLVMLGVSLLFTLFVFAGFVRWEGFVLMIIFVAYIIFLYKQNKAERENNGKNEEKCEKEDENKEEDEVEKEDELKKPRIEKQKGLAKQILFLIVGCAGVFIGAKLLVDSAIDIATIFGISDTVIGSTLVAFGTSVPELAVSMTGILKKHEEISLGNVIGSNIFNILWVIGISAMVQDLPVDYKLLYINIPIMLFVSALLLIFMATKKRLTPWDGVIFITMYTWFLVFNYW
ncbi:MAG: calcium/sodium antiporter [Thermoplasmata archaeon]|nr:MAG: calcium/sodium antiporter [Thermoplasmata archaeon]